MQNVNQKTENQNPPIIVQALMGKLDDCITMIDCIPDAGYILTVPYKASPDKTHSSIGQHTRHIIEFVETFLTQKESGNVNYDARERNSTVETNRDTAKKAIRTVQDSLTKIKSDDLFMPMNVHEAVHVQFDIKPQASSLGREILFVISHTEHHFALISSQCDALGIALPNHFGKAISTLRHELQQ